MKVNLEILFNFIAYFQNFQYLTNYTSFLTSFNFLQFQQMPTNF